MLSYLIQRLLWIPPILLGISLVVFLGIRVAPGDPSLAAVGVGQGGPGQQDAAGAVEALRHREGLDRSLLVQFLGFVGPLNTKPDGHPWFGGSGREPFGGILALDLGTEFGRPGVPIAGELAKRLRVTLPLALISMFLVYACALPLGIFSARRSGTRVDLALSTWLLLLYSVPAFWAGLILIMGFGITGLDWLPTLGLHAKDAQGLGSWAYAWDLFLHSILPVLCLTYGGIAYLSKQMRVGLLEVLGADYIRTARAKGLSERRVIFKHALRNALLPVITLFASLFPMLIGGALIVEVIFDLPGMGRYAYEGLLARDYGIIMATTMLSAVMTLAGMLLSDLAYALVDPRIHYG